MVILKNPPPTKGRPEYIRENFARNHGTQGTATSRLFKSWKDSMGFMVRPHPDPALREEGTAFVCRLKFPRLYCNRRFLNFVKMSVRFFEGRTMILPLRQRSWGRGPARRAVASEGGGKAIFPYTDAALAQTFDLLDKK
jgi:hypothetical protein